jgi:hypothetical protein
MCFNQHDTLFLTTPCFSSVVRQMPGYNSQDEARPALPNFPISVLCVLFVCKCVMYCCHRVSTQLRLKNIYIYHIIIPIGRVTFKKCWSSWHYTLFQRTPVLLHLTLRSTLPYTSAFHRDMAYYCSEYLLLSVLECLLFQQTFPHVLQSKNATESTV